MARQRRTAQVVRGVGMGKGWLLKRMRRGVLSRLTFTDNSIVRCLDQAWLRKATDIVGGEERERELNTGRDLLPQVSSLILAMVGQPPPRSLYQPTPAAGKGWEGP